MEWWGRVGYLPAGHHFNLNVSLGGFGPPLKVMSRSILQSNCVSMPFDDQFLLPRKVTPLSVTVCASLAITLLMVAGAIYVSASYLIG
jgi:hypothetical protein